MDTETDRLRWELADALASEKIARQSAQSALDALKGHRRNTVACVADLQAKADLADVYALEVAAMRAELATIHAMLWGAP